MRFAKNAKGKWCKALAKGNALKISGRKIEDSIPACSNVSRGQYVIYNYPGDNEFRYNKTVVTIDAKCRSSYSNELFCLHDIPSVTDQPNLIGGPVIRENCDQSKSREGRCLQGNV